MKANSAIFLIQFLLLISSSVTKIESSCQTQCGNITIPYPFGIGTSTNCFRPGFNLICINNTTLLLGDGTKFEVTGISLAEGQVFINTNVTFSYCSNHDVAQDYNNTSNVSLRSDGPYRFSGDRNTFVTIGCDVISSVKSVVATSTAAGPSDSDFDNFCASVCLNGTRDVRDGQCSGIGCFYSNDSKIPAVLDWAIVGNDTWKFSCKNASNNLTMFACRSDNSYCSDVPDRGGYLCQCISGFAGNPYIPHGSYKFTEFFKSFLLVTLISLFNLDSSQLTIKHVLFELGETLLFLIIYVTNSMTCIIAYKYNLLMIYSKLKNDENVQKLKNSSKHINN